MASLRDMFRRSWGGRSPEEFVAELKEKLHTAVNNFKDDETSREKLRQILQSIKKPLMYFNMWMARPQMANSDQLKELAQKYNIRKTDLKRMFRTSIELEEALNKYFGQNLDVDQLIVVLRKVVNALDEHVIGDAFDAFDRNVDYEKIEKAYLDYQDKVQKYYNASGLNRDLQNIFEHFIAGFKKTVSSSHQSKQNPSDTQPEIKMMDPKYQRLYDHFREEGYTHDDTLKFIAERKDVDSIPEAFIEAYRVFRQEGKTHPEAMEYVKALSDKSHT